MSLDSAPREGAILEHEMEDLVTIGEFAAAARLSQKALRLYGENGLLVPAWVDPESGYRYYAVEQLRSATLIALLRRAGMSLAEIRRFLQAPTTVALDEYERALTDELAERRRALQYVKRVLREESMYDVQTKDVGDQPYVSRKKSLRVNELVSFITETFDDLGATWDGGAKPFALYHGPVNNDDDGPVEVCVPKGNGDQTLPAGTVVFTEISGKQCMFPEILGAYEAVYRWIRENGRRESGPAREIYLTPEGEDMRLEIAVPLA